MRRGLLLLFLLLVSTVAWLLCRENSQPTAAGSESLRAATLTTKEEPGQLDPNPRHHGATRPTAERSARDGAEPARITDSVGGRPDEPRFVIPSLVGEEHHANWGRTHLAFSPSAVIVLPGHFPGDDLSVWALVSTSGHASAEHPLVRCPHMKLDDSRLLVCAPTVDARGEPSRSVNQRLTLVLRRGARQLDRAEIGLPYHRQPGDWVHTRHMKSILDFPGYSAVKLAYHARRRAGTSRLDALRRLRADVVGATRLFRTSLAQPLDETPQGARRASALRERLSEFEQNLLVKIDGKIERAAQER